MLQFFIVVWLELDTLIQRNLKLLENWEVDSRDIQKELSCQDWKVPQDHLVKDLLKLLGMLMQPGWMVKDIEYFA